MHFTFLFVNFSVYDVHSIFSGRGSIVYGQSTQMEAIQEQAYEPKIAEQLNTRSRGSLMNMLARNFKAIEKITLYLAFFINVILLFHRVDIATNKDPSKKPEGEEESDKEDAKEDILETIYITGMTLPYISYEITGWLLTQVIHFGDKFRR